MRKIFGDNLPVLLWKNVPTQKTQRSSYLNSTDEATPGSHTKSHGGLAALLLHGPSLQVEDPPVVLAVVDAGWCGGVGGL